MKITQVRLGVFETNSSSTHSLVVCTKEEYEKWKSGELLYDGEFITSEEALLQIQKYTPEVTKIEDVDNLREYDIFTFEDWGYDYDTETNKYTTKGGEELVIRSYFGYDG